MYLLNILYFIFKESFSYIGRNKTITILSIAITSFSLFTVSFFLLITENINNLINKISDEININIYLKDDITKIQKEYIEKLINNNDYVSSYVFISKEKALKDFLIAMPNLASLINNLKENPIPSSYKIILKKEYNSENAIENFIKIFKDAEGIEEIQYDKQWFEKLTSIVRILKFVGVILGSILIFTALFTIANVIRLVVYSRKDEIEILKLVGANNFCIKSPFIIEGIFQGFSASVVALFFLYISYQILSYYLTKGISVSSEFIKYISTNSQVLIILMGMMVGFVGSYFSVSRLVPE